MQRTLCNRKPTIIACFTGFYQSPCQSGLLRLRCGLAGRPRESVFRYDFRSYSPISYLG